MSRFKKGDTVYMGRGENLKTLIVKAVHDNPMLPVYQYSFEGESFACGEQSIRADKYGEDLKIRDCYKNTREEVDKQINTIINTNAMVFNSAIDDGIKINDRAHIFFKPDMKMVKWLKEYANGRVIIDVGSGQGHLLRLLKVHGAQVLGLEPEFDYNAYMTKKITCGEGFNPNEILPWSVQEAKGLISGMGNKAMLVFARPCHSDFVEAGIENMPIGMEALYITKPENIIKYKDLGRFDSIKKKLEHEGSGEENEVIYSIIK